MKLFHTDRFHLPLPDGHTFPVAKYALLRRRVEDAGLVAPENLIEPEAATREQLERAHDPEYVRKVLAGELSVDEIRAIGLPWSLELVERSLRSVGATIAAGLAALQDGIGVSLAGGTHHASRDRGAGYCVFNDAAVCVREIQAKSLVRRAVILDLDVHQGDGTARIFADDPSVFTLSIHGARNYPLRKPPSDLDLALDDGTTDGPYLDAVVRGVAEAIERSSAEFAVYLAGADPYLGDRLGKLAVSKVGLAERDRLVFTMCRDAGLPVAVTMAGGYARTIEDTVDIQFATILAAAQVFGIGC